MNQEIKSKIYISTSVWGQVAHLADKLFESGEDLERKRIVICEEKFTLTCEKYLAEKLGGIISTRVLSFGKICDTLKTREKYLSKTSEIMLLAKVASNIKDSLELFSNACLRPSFAGSLYDILSLLASSHTDFDSLEKAVLPPALEKKIADICKINREYQAEKKGLFLDATDKMEALYQSCDSVEILKNAEIYILGHTAFTNQMLAVISKLAQRGNLFVYLLNSSNQSGVKEIFENCGVDFEIQNIKENFPQITKNILRGINGENASANSDANDLENANGLENQTSDGLENANANIALYEFSSHQFECEHIALKIKHLLEGGEKPENIKLILANFENQLDFYCESFSSLGIPFFANKSETLEKFPFPQHILNLINLTCSNYSLESVRGVLKSSFSPLPPEESFNFENFIISRNIDRGRFFKDEIFKKAGYLQTRNEFLERTNIFEKHAFTTGEFADIIRTFAQQNINTLAHMSCNLTALGRLDKADFLPLSIKKTFEVLGEMELILQGETLTLEELAVIFEGGLLGKEISIIPSHIHAVEISDIASGIMAQKPHVFITSACKSFFPSSQKDTALLSDKDILTLSLGKINVSPSVEFLNEKQWQLCFLTLLSGSETLSLSYSLLTNGGKETPSEFFELLAEICDVAKPQSEYHFALELCKTTLENALATHENSALIAHKTLEHTIFSKSQAVALFAREHIKENSIAREISACIYSAFAKNGESATLDEITAKSHLQFVETPLARKEFSPSLLESYFSCPYQSFLSQNIRLSDREVGILKEFDTGNFLHSLLEEFSQSANEIKQEEISQKVSCIASTLQNSPAFEKFAEQDKFQFVFTRLVREADKICHHIYKTNQISKFLPTAHEFTFGGDRKVTTDGGLSIRGKVDRVDSYGNDIIVVDYKTGHVNLSADAFYYGLKLQSELYLYAVSKLTGKNPVGAVYLPISDNFDDTPVSYRMKGKLLSDEEFLKNLDTSITNGQASEIYPIALKVKGGYSSKSTLEKPDFERHIQNAVKTAEQGKAELEMGYIFPSPYNDSAKDSCKYCRFTSICKSCGEDNTRGGKVADENATSQENPQNQTNPQENTQENTNSQENSQNQTQENANSQNQNATLQQNEGGQS